MSGPVVRIWRATIARGDIDDWVATYRARVLPDMRRVEGFRGVRFLVDRTGDPCAVTVLTTFDDMDAVRRFAGDDPGRTVLPDFMARFFPSYDARATFHEQVLAEAAA